MIAMASRGDDAPTFSKDVAPIVFENCAACHHPGEVAPFPLLSYADVKKKLKTVSRVVNNRVMPPWKADEGAEKFCDARHLSDAQIATIQKWVAGGAPEGNPADIPPVPKFQEGWQLGEPDVVFQPSEDFKLPAEGRDIYQCFVIPTICATDRWVAALEVRPGNRSVVHHVIAYLDTTGTARKKDEADPGPGYRTFGGIGFAPSGSLGGWAPGTTPRRWPDGIGTFFPKNADIVLQVHYHLSGKAETDRTKIGVYFCHGPVDKRVRVIMPFPTTKLQIPAGETNFVMRGQLPVPEDVHLVEVMPHMHLIGHDMTVTAALPDGSEKKIVRVPDWDFNWQMHYRFKEPMKIPAGSHVSLIAHYDNSENNPNNPSHPPAFVSRGEQTTNEMCIAFLYYTVDSEHLTQGKESPGMFKPRFGGGLLRALRGGNQ